MATKISAVDEVDSLFAGLDLTEHTEPTDSKVDGPQKEHGWFLSGDANLPLEQHAKNEHIPRQTPTDQTPKPHTDPNENAGMQNELRAALGNMPTEEEEDDSVEELDITDDTVAPVVVPSGLKQLMKNPRIQHELLMVCKMRFGGQASRRLYIMLTRTIAIAALEGRLAMETKDWGLKEDAWFNQAISEWPEINYSHFLYVFINIVYNPNIEITKLAANKEFTHTQKSTVVETVHEVVEEASLVLSDLHRSNKHLGAFLERIVPGWRSMDPMLVLSNAEQGQISCLHATNKLCTSGAHTEEEIEELIVGAKVAQLADMAKVHPIYMGMFVLEQKTKKETPAEQETNPRDAETTEN